MLKETIGLIGCGNMGSAIVSGLLRNRIARPNQVFVYDSIRSKRNALAKKFRTHVAQSNQDLIRRVQIVLLAVKPQDLGSVTNEVRRNLRSGQIIISILAGVPVA